MLKVKENQIIESVQEGKSKEFQSLFDNSNFDIDHQFMDGKVCKSLNFNVITIFIHHVK